MSCPSSCMPCCVARWSDFRPVHLLESLTSGCPLLWTKFVLCSQVSAFGDDNNTDTGDVWVVTAGSSKAYQFWQREGQVLQALSRAV